MNHNRTRDAPDFLRGVVIAEYGDGLAGAAATATLAAMGADVTTVPVRIRCCEGEFRRSTQTDSQSRCSALSSMPTRLCRTNQRRRARWSPSSTAARARVRCPTCPSTTISITSIGKTALSG